MRHSISDNKRSSRRMQARYFLLVTHILIALMVVARCASLVSYYDATTYTNLTHLKPEVAFLYETFTNDSVDSVKINEIRLKLAQAYEYEKGKGAKNQETYEQIEIIQIMFERHVADRLENGKWSEEHMENKKTNIEEAFDIAIETEWLKNRNQ